MVFSKKRVKHDTRSSSKYSLSTAQIKQLVLKGPPNYKTIFTNHLHNLNKTSIHTN